MGGRLRSQSLWGKKKKVQTKYGELSVGWEHCLAPGGKQGFRASPFLQELACHVGQSVPFDEGSELLWKLGGCELSDKQIERISHHYGEELGQQEAEEADSQPLVVKTELHYALADGSMVYTREDGWREMKLGRVFAASSLVAYKGRREVATSRYTAHLGGHADFFQKFDRHLDGLRNLVVLADGASWIWDFFDANYPDAVQILDFFHAAERLGQFALLHFKDKEERDRWTDAQKAKLLEDGVDEVRQNLKELHCGAQALDCQQKTLTYLANNRHRMLYKTYKDKGYLIGSGPIESAHRHVIQQRLKLAGQRWTRNGAQQIATLRVAYKNDQTDQLLKLIRKAA